MIGVNGVIGANGVNEGLGGVTRSQTGSSLGVGGGQRSEVRGHGLGSHPRVGTALPPPWCHNRDGDGATHGATAAPPHSIGVTPRPPDSQEPHGDPNGL